MNENDISYRTEMIQKVAKMVEAKYLYFDHHPKGRFSDEHWRIWIEDLRGETPYSWQMFFDNKQDFETAKKKLEQNKIELIDAGLFEICEGDC